MAAWYNVRLNESEVTTNVRRGGPKERPLVAPLERPLEQVQGQEQGRVPPHLGSDKKVGSYEIRLF